MLIPFHCFQCFTNGHSPISLFFSLSIYNATYCLHAVEMLRLNCHHCEVLSLSHPPSSHSLSLPSALSHTLPPSLPPSSSLSVSLSLHLIMWLKYQISHQAIWRKCSYHFTIFSISHMDIAPSICL